MNLAYWALLIWAEEVRRSEEAEHPSTLVLSAPISIQAPLDLIRQLVT